MSHGPPCMNVNMGLPCLLKQWMRIPYLMAHMIG